MKTTRTVRLEVHFTKLRRAALSNQHAFFLSALNAVRINEPVRSVRIYAGHVEVELRGETLKADDVILTAPPSVWNKINFTPALPPRAIVQTANSVKYVGVTQGRPWADPVIGFGRF